MMHNIKFSKHDLCDERKSGNKATNKLLKFGYINFMNFLCLSNPYSLE